MSQLLLIHTFRERTIKEIRFAQNNLIIEVRALKLFSHHLFGKLFMFSKDKRFSIFTATAIGILIFMSYRQYLMHPLMLPVVGGMGDGIRHILPLHYLFNKSAGLVLWNPFIFSGHPLYAESQAAPLFPLTWICSSFLAPETAYGFLAMFYSALCAIGSYLLLRHWKCGRLPAILGSTLYFLNFGFSAPSYVMTMAWWPLVHLYASKILSGKSKNILFNTLLGAVLLSFYIAGSHPPVMTYSLIISAIILLFEWIVSKRSFRSSDEMIHAQVCPKWGIRWLFVFLGCGLAFLLASYQIFPMMEFGKLSHRYGMESWYFSTKSSFFLDQDIRGLFGFWGGTTAVTWLFVMLAIGCSKREWRIKLFLVIITFGALYSLGNVTPVVFIVQLVLPPLRNFRNPDSIGILIKALLIFTGCLGVQSFLTMKEECHPGRMIIRIAVVAGVFFCGWLFLTFGDDFMMSLGRGLYEVLIKGAPFEKRQDEILHAMEIMRRGLGYVAVIMAGTGTAAALILLFYRIGKKIMLLIIPIMMCWVAWVAPVGVAEVEIVFSENELIKFLNERQGQYRVLNMNEGRTRIIDAPMAVRYNIELADGCDSLIPANYWKNWIAAMPDPGKYYNPSTKLPLANLDPDQIADMDILRKWNVRYVVSETPATREDLREVARFDEMPTYIFPDGPGKFERVYVYEVQGPVSERVRLLKPAGEGEAEGRIIKYIKKDEAIHIEIDVSESALVVAVLSDFPCWRVRVDGEERKKISFNNEMPAVEISQGRHQVEFFVRPRSLIIGLKLTLLGVLIFLILGGITLIGKKKRAGKEKSQKIE